MKRLALGLNIVFLVLACLSAFAGEYAIAAVCWFAWLLAFAIYLWLYFGDKHRQRDKRLREYTPEDCLAVITELTRRINAGAGDRVENLISRASWYQQLGQWQESMTDLDQAFSLSHDHTAEIHKYRGLARYNLKDFPGAIEPLSLAIDQFRKSVDSVEELLLSLDYRSLCYSELEQYRAALVDLEDYFSKGKGDSRHYALRENLKCILMQWDSAVPDLKTAIKMDSQNTSAWHQLGYVQACCPDSRLRDGQRALQATTRACELTEWKNWAYVSGVAAAYAELGDFENAVKYAEMACELAPEAEKPIRHKRTEQYRRGIPYRHEPSNLPRQYTSEV